MTDQTKIAEELAEPHHFGSHNIYMPEAPIGHFLPYYPWRTLFEQLPLEGAYPQILYTNAQADALFDAVSLQLAALVSDETFHMEVSLQYPSDISVDEVREGYLTVIISDPIVPKRLEGLPLDIAQDLWLDMLAMSLLHYILQTEMAPEEHIQVAVSEMPSQEHTGASGDMRPEWLELWQQTEQMIHQSDGTHRYRYGFRLTLEGRA